MSFDTVWEEADSLLLSLLKCKKWVFGGCH